MELRQVHSLLLLSELGSILRVARQCHLSPAAVHKHLKSLEQELGARLYTRQQGSLRLTEAGQMILPYLQEMAAQRDAAVAALADWRQAKRGQVRVGAGPIFSSQLLPTLLKRFRKKFPGVDVFVETGNGEHLREHLLSGALDLTFDLAVTVLDQPSLEVAAQWEATIAFVSALPGLPVACRLRDLRGVPFILFQKGSQMDELIQHYFNELAFQPTVIMRSDSAEAIRSMVRARLGISLLFQWNVTADLRSGTLHVLRPEAPPLRSRMALVKRRTRYTPQPVGEFIELARRMHWKDLRLAGA
jgi:DNA-binding transcriptional LysR family regulator